MTDLPEHETHEEGVLLDALDGNTTALAMVQTDPQLIARFNALSAQRDALRASTPAIDPSVRVTSIAAALSVYDDMQSSAAAASEVAALRAPKRRSLRLFRSAGALAATAAVVVGVVAIAPNLSSEDSVTSSDNALASATTGAASITAPAADAPSSARSDSQTATTFAERLESAAGATEPADASEATSAPAFTTTTTLTAAEAPTAGPDADEEADVVDPLILQCAASRGVDTTQWIRSAHVIPEPAAGISTSFVIDMSDGRQLDVEFIVDRCAEATFGEPRDRESDDQ
jgi:hypothetical protein